MLAGTGFRLLQSRNVDEVHAIAAEAVTELAEPWSGVCYMIGRTERTEFIVQRWGRMSGLVREARIPIALVAPVDHQVLPATKIGARLGAELSALAGRDCAWLAIGMGADRMVLIGAQDGVPDEATNAIGVLAAQAQLAEHTCNLHVERLRQGLLDAASAALLTARTRGEAIEMVLESASRLDPAVRGAAIMIGSAEVRAHGTTGHLDPADTPAFDLADVPADVMATLAGAGCAALSGLSADALAAAAGLVSGPVTMAAPLMAQDERFGLLVLTLGYAPPFDLSAAVTTLATQTALALNQLLTNERLRVIVEGSPDAHLLTSADGTIRYTNPAAQRLFGLPAEALVRRKIAMLVHPDDLAGLRGPTGDPADAVPQVCRILAAGDVWCHVEGVVVRVTERDGSTSLVVNIRDISDRQRLEAELRHAQKLESVGRLAGGIAHEINTPVQFIGDNVRFIQQSFTDLMALHGAYATAIGTVADEQPGLVEGVRQLELDVDLDFVLDEVPQALRQTMDGVERVATIVRAMKAFGHPAGKEKAPVSLNDTIATTLVVANNELKYVADVRTTFGDLPPVLSHAGDISQVLLNLVVNAAHAVAAADRGRGLVEVSTRLDGDCAVIDVTDSGTGIPPEIADKIFEPFFTTKGVGAGTGQGLALAHSLVVERHGGRLEFSTRPGEGTTFTVRLPVSGSASGLRLAEAAA